MNGRYKILPNDKIILLDYNYEGVNGKLSIYRDNDQTRKGYYDISVYTIIYLEIDNKWCTPRRLKISGPLSL